MMAPTDKDIIVPGKPRLAEALGVEEDKPWAYPGIGGIFRIHNGFRQRKFPDGQWGDIADEVELTIIINHPDRIIRTILTDPEISIMRAVGAKWVSLAGPPTDAVRVELWTEKPEHSQFGTYIGQGSVARVNADLFPSIKPGDLVEVPE